ncbi:MAG TPA: site-2 protease family protein [Chitinophagales bacterium]|nr:site-2 protease family protein [Chitinophagales bacterium]
MAILIKAAQVLCGLSISILCYTMAQYIAARLFNTRVEKLYLFFDFLFPFPGLLNFALFKKKVGHTEFGLGWMPLGGYLKIAGMDEVLPGEEGMPARDYEFGSKKRYQRYIILSAGIIGNLMLLALLYWLLSGSGAKGLFGWFWPVTPLSPVWNWYSFGRLTAFISLLIVVSNTLQLPALLRQWR